MVERISTFGLSQTMLQSAMTLQLRMTEKQIASSSGLVTDTYANLSSQAGRLVSLETTLARTTTWSSNTQTALDRSTAMYGAVGSMIDSLTSLRASLSAAKSDTTGAGDYSSLGADAIKDLTALMNLQVNGRYLFAGSRSDTAPVDTSALTAPTLPSTADTSYYRGDTETMSVRTSEQQTIEYGVTAEGGGFEKALRAVNIMANLNNSNLDRDAVTEAYELATEALDALLTSQSHLSQSAKRLENSLASQSGYASLIGDMISDIKSVDVAAVTVEISQYETTLQASYSALGKISRLSLTDYL